MKLILAPFGVAAALALLAPVLHAQNLLTNGGLELELDDFGGADSVPPGWEMVEGGTLPHPDDLSTAEPGNFFHLLHEGEWHMWFQPYQASFYNNGGFAHLTQTVPATSGLAYTMTGWSLFEAHYAGGVDNLNQPGTDTSDPEDGPPSTTDSFFALEFLDAGGAVLPGSVEAELRADGQMNDTTWRQHTLGAVAPGGAVNVRVRASMTGGIWNQDADPQSYLVDDFILTAAAAPVESADFDDDGDVDGDDFLHWQRGLGTASGATLAQGDGNGDGIVDATDLSIWKSQFDAAATGAAGSIPEPLACSLAILGFTGIAACRRRT